MKKFLVVITGPTAVGKTAVSIRVASHFKTEIISADARQFYREMNIGTAKPSAQELNAVPHHFISHLSVHENYSAGDFEKDALQKIEALFENHSLLVLTGGSGLFINAVLNGFDRFPEVKPEVKEELQKRYAEDGIPGLQKLLKDADPVYYEKVDRDNPQRLLRALEVSISSGQAYSSFLKSKNKARDFTAIMIGLEMEREELYRMIDGRTGEMMQKGLLAEAQSLYHLRHLNALQTVGYNELFDYIDGKTSLEEAVNLVSQHTRNYAKRQMTWFRKQENIKWFHPSQVEEIISYIEACIRL